jgi:hypothetical protein
VVASQYKQTLSVKFQREEERKAKAHVNKWPVIEVTGNLFNMSSR